ncbi:hypothetical protein Hdeb2414_s0020g00566101 [Helianthus debilis subsp. tardiflorus]
MCKCDSDWGDVQTLAWQIRRMIGAYLLPSLQPWRTDPFTHPRPDATADPTTTKQEAKVVKILFSFEKEKTVVTEEIRSQSLHKP